MLLVSETVGEQANEAVEGEPTERRRGLRVRQSRPVKVYDAAAARYFGGKTEDISATGLRIELPVYAPLEPGDTLNIHVGLNAKGQPLANRRQMVSARVVWVCRQDTRIHGTLEAGVEFITSIAAHLDAA